MKLLITTQVYENYGAHDWTVWVSALAIGKPRAVLTM
jgi:hypothetical protein